MVYVDVNTTHEELNGIRQKARHIYIYIYILVRIEINTEKAKYITCQ